MRVFSTPSQTVFWSMAGLCTDQLETLITPHQGQSAGIERLDLEFNSHPLMGQNSVLENALPYQWICLSNTPPKGQ